MIEIDFFGEQERYQKMAEDQQNNSTTTNQETNRSTFNNNRNFRRFIRFPNLLVDDKSRADPGNWRNYWIASGNTYY